MAMPPSSGSVAEGPGEAVGAVAGGDAGGDFEGFQVEDGDDFFTGDGDIGARAIRKDENALGLAAEAEALDFLAGWRVEDDQLVAGEIGDEGELAIGSELEAVGALGVEVERLNDFFRRDVDDGNSAVAGIGGPEFAAVGRNVATFGTFADGNDGGAPAGGVGAALKHSDGVRADVGSEEQRAVLREDEHVSAVLADAEEPVELIGGGIVAGDESVVFGGEPDLAIGEGDAVRAAQSAEINAAEFLLSEQINHRKSVAWGASAVVGDEGEFAVVGGGDFVRSFAGGDLGHGLESGGIDDGKRGVFLIEDEKGGGRGLRLGRSDLRQEEKGQHEIGDDGFSDCSGEVHGWSPRRRSDVRGYCKGILELRERVDGEKPEKQEDAAGQTARDP